MIARSHKLSVSRQAKLLGISRGAVYYVPKPTSESDRLYATLCGRPYLQVAALGANGLAGRCLSLDMRR